MNINDFTPGRQLYLQVRAGFITQDSTLGGWCRENGVLPQNALSVLAGTWNGPKAKALRLKIIEASGITSSAAA